MFATAVQKFHADNRHTNPSNAQRKSKGIAIQAKLTVGKPDDKYEQEANRIADQVMRMPDRATVLRKCAGCKKEEKIQQKPLAAGITPYVQRQAKGEPQVSPALESRLNSSKGGGRSLPGKTRSFMENSIGADFSNVKVHTDSNAVQMSRELGAQAFTHGNNIYFNTGKYNPESASGKHLLAHEMVHTLHQRREASIQTQIDSTNERATCPQYEGYRFMHTIRDLGPLHPKYVEVKDNYIEDAILNSVKTDFINYAIRVARLGYHALLCVNRVPSDDQRFSNYQRFNDRRYICQAINIIRYVINNELPEANSVSEVNNLLELYIISHRNDFTYYPDHYLCDIDWS